MIVRGRHTRRLPDVRDDDEAANLPPVSVVVAARNEAATVEQALRSLLALRYPDLEIIVVEDRSTDATGAILERIARENPRMRLVRVRELPAGWLGKNHALSLGAAEARGDWILFTDADVHLAPGALRRGIRLALDSRLDHLAVAPTLLMPGIPLALFATGFALLFAQFTRPWRARDPRSSRHIGIGAFNLVRAEAYRAVGGHHPIRMRPDDDLRLGRILKEAGHRQDFAFGGRDLVVEWYTSLGEAMRGLEKNTFAGVDYSLPRALVAGNTLGVLGLLPVVTLLFASGLSQMVALVTCLFIMLIFAGSMRGSGGNPLLAPAFPIAVVLILLIAGRATALTLLRGGIRWRDTFYSLDELRGGEPVAADPKRPAA